MKYYDPTLEKKATQVMIYKIVFLSLLLLYFTSCSNILNEMGKKNREEGLIKNIEIALKTDPSEALTLYQALPATISSKREHQLLFASIYASLCGQNFFDVTEAISGSNTLFVNLMANFPGATDTEIGYCTQARDILASIDINANGRTLDENLMMTYISWSTLGVISSKYADANADGAVDGGVDPCNSGQIPDADIANIGVALNHMFDSLTEAAGGSSVGGGQLNLMDAICNVGSPPNFCNVKVPATLAADSQAVKEIRSITKSDNSIGLAVCGACICP